ncbi:MAG: biopolymer transporter ExbD [Planctomycetales bacterium]
MRVRKTRQMDAGEGDMTPMIDMVFQLIAFFMVLVNFTEVDQHEKVILPKSELAKPRENPLELPLTLNLAQNGDVFLSGRKLRVSDVGGALSSEREIMRSAGDNPADATIIIRAHKFAKSGDVQELIGQCQKASFEKFALRAEEKTEP